MRVGLVGTGYAGKLRAQTLLSDERTDLVAVVGNKPVKAEAFARDFQCEVIGSSQQLIEQDDIDLVIVTIY